jgi:hypothetical protein
MVLAGGYPVLTQNYFCDIVDLFDLVPLFTSRQVPQFEAFWWDLSQSLNSLPLKFKSSAGSIPNASAIFSKDSKDAALSPLSIRPFGQFIYGDSLSGSESSQNPLDPGGLAVCLLYCRM